MTGQPNRRGRPASATRIVIHPPRLIPMDEEHRREAVSALAEILLSELERRKQRGESRHI